MEKLFVEAAGRARVETVQLKLTWYYQDVSILLPIISPMSTGAIADCKTRRLFANLLIFSLIFVHFSYRILYALLLQTLRQFCHRKPRCTAHDELLERVVHEFVLFLYEQTRVLRNKLLKYTINNQFSRKDVRKKINDKKFNYRR